MFGARYPHHTLADPLQLPYLASAMNSHISRAFTLIELLVVIAIIGTLSAVVLASLNIARERGKESSIKATLKSMSAEIELMAESQPNYNFVNSCATNGLKKYVDALTAQGATVRCDSFPSPSGTTDNYSRWGVAVSTSGSTLPLKAWSASPEGVVTWDAADSNSWINWTNSTAACAAQGKRLPSAEELRALWRINGSNPAPGFDAVVYWSRTEVPGVSANNAYSVGMSHSGVGSNSKSSSAYVRCVK